MLPLLAIVIIVFTYTILFFRFVFLLDSFSLLQFAGACVSMLCVNYQEIKQTWTWTWTI